MFSFVVKGINTKDEQTFVLRHKINKPTGTTLIFKSIWTGKNQMNQKNFLSVYYVPGFV